MESSNPELKDEVQQQVNLEEQQQVPRKPLQQPNQSEDDVRRKMKNFVKFLVNNFITEIRVYEEVIKGKYSRVESTAPVLKSFIIALPKLASNNAKSFTVPYKEMDKYIKYIKSRHFGKALSKFTHSYNDNEEYYNRILIQAGIVIFTIYEMQFSNCFVDDCDEFRALEKIAYDVARRILNSITEKEADVVFSEEFIIDCIRCPKEWKKFYDGILSCKIPPNRTVKLRTLKGVLEVKTFDLLSKVGFVTTESATYKYFGKKNSETSKYGYRRLFETEKVVNLVEEQNQYLPYKFILLKEEKSILIEQYLNDLIDKTLKDVEITVISEIMENRKQIIHETRIQSKMIHEKLDILVNREQDTLKNEKTEPFLFEIKGHVFNFTGREKYLEQIKDNFHEDKNVIVVTGMAGVGKTELMKKYIDESKTKYETFIWVNAESEQDLKQSFLNIASELKIPIRSNEQERQIHMIVQDVFLEIKKRKCQSLIIYDNAESYRILKKFILSMKDLQESHTYVLITSRNKDWPSYDYHNIYLNNLTPNESRLLMEFSFSRYEKILTSFKESEHLVTEILTNIQGLPLVLQQVIAYIIESSKIRDDNPFTDFLEKYEVVLNHRYDEQQPFPDYYDNDYERTIFVTYKMILERIKEQGEKILDLLQICSYLNPYGIRKYIVNFFLNDGNINSSFRILKKYCLMQSEDDSYIIHRVISEITRQLCLANNDYTAYTKILEFILNFNYVIQLNPIMLTTSDQFFQFLTDINGHYVFQHVDKIKDFTLQFYESLVEGKKNQFFSLLVYYGCSETVEKILQEKNINLFIDTEILNIDDINNFIRDKLSSCQKNDATLIKIQQEQISTSNYLFKKKYKGSAIHIACSQGHVKITDYLVEKGADVNEKNDYGFPLTHCALLNEHIDLFYKLMEHNADLYATDNIGSSLLHVAAMMGRNDVINYLLKKGIKLDVKNSFGDTFLHSLVYNQIFPSEQLLFLFSSSGTFFIWDLKTEECRYLETLTQYCFLYKFTKHLDCAERRKYLLLYFNYLEKDKKNNYLKILEEHYDKLNFTGNIFGMYPLHLYALSNNVSLVEYMLSLKDVLFQDKRGSDPLMYACGNDSLNAAQLLFEVEQYLNNINDYGLSALHLAACNGNYNIINFLLSKVDLCNFSTCHFTVLHAALINKHFEIAKMLIEKGADVNRTYFGISALHLAAKAGNSDIVEQLIKKDTLIIQPDDYKWTALHYATSSSLYNKNLIKFMSSEIPEFFKYFDVTEDKPSLSCVSDQDNKLDYLLDTYQKDKTVQLNIPDIVTDFIMSRNMNNPVSAESVREQLCTDNPINILYKITSDGQLKTITALLKKVNVNCKNSQGCTALHFAALNTETSVIDLLLENGANIYMLDNVGRSALHWASVGGRLETIKLLIFKGADINLRGRDENSVLHVAAHYGHNETVKWLLDQGFDIRIHNKFQQTALYLAAYNGYTDTVRLLLDRGADINQCDERGWTALHSAVKYGHLNTVALLLEKGSDVNAGTKEGFTALHVIAQNSFTDITALFLSRATNLNDNDENDYEKNVQTNVIHKVASSEKIKTIRLLLEKGVHVNAHDKDGQTALHIASLDGYIEVAELLLENNADINARSKDGSTSLHAATRSKHLNIATLLIDKGIDINACDNKGWTALHLALHCGWKDISTLLIDKGIDINACDNKGRTALHLAVYYGWEDISELLCKRGIDINAYSKEEHTALHIAVLRAMSILVSDISNKYNILDPSEQLNLLRIQFSGLVILLLEAGADSNAPYIDGQTALHYASRYGSEYLVTLLLGKGANVNACSETGYTALHSAAKNGHSEIIKLLLDKGADIHACDSDGHTALYFATEGNHSDAVALLQEMGAV